MNNVMDLRDYQRRNRKKGDGGTLQQRRGDVQRVGTTTIILASDDTPLGHGGLSLRLVVGIESYCDEPIARGFPCSSESASINREDENEFVGAFGEIDTPMRARKQQVAANRALKKFSTQVDKPSSKRIHLLQAEKDIFNNSFSGCSQGTSVAQSLDPLNCFAPRTERLSSKPTLLLGLDQSESDDELFADEQMYPGSFGRRKSGVLSPNGVNEPVEVSPKETTFAQLSEKRSPLLTLASLALKDTLPRHPPNNGGAKTGTADWTKLMVESRTCEPSESFEHTNASTAGDDSVENSTVSSGSALHRTGNDTFAQLDLCDSDGIRMVSTTAELDDDSTGLHNRRALTEKEGEFKRQSVMFSGISALKSLGTEMILKAETTIAQPRPSGSRKSQGGGLASARSLSFRLSSGKPGSSAGNSSLAPPKAPRPAKSSSFPTIFPTKEDSCALIFDNDQGVQGE